MWDEGIHIYDTPGVHDNFPYNSTILINEKKKSTINCIFNTQKSFQFSIFYSTI